MHTVSFKIEEAKMLIFWKGEKCRMNQRALEKVRENYRQLAAPSGLRLSEEDCIICGSFGGYQVIVHPTVNGSRAYYNTLTVEIAAKTSGDPISKQDWKLYTKEHKNVSSAVQNQYLIILVLKNIMKYEFFLFLAGNQWKTLYLNHRFDRQPFPDTIWEMQIAYSIPVKTQKTDDI